MISCSRQTDSPLEMLLKKVRMEKILKAELSLTAIVYLTLVLWAMISLMKKKILTIQMKIAKLKAITVEDAMGSFRECYIYNHEH